MRQYLDICPEIRGFLARSGASSWGDLAHDDEAPNEDAPSVRDSPEDPVRTT